MLPHEPGSIFQGRQLNARPFLGSITRVSFKAEIMLLGLRHGPISKFKREVPYADSKWQECAACGRCHTLQSPWCVGIKMACFGRGSSGSMSEPSFDDYLRAGGWRGYAQKAAKSAFVTEARSWLEPLQQMLDAEEARLRALESTTADDLLAFVAIKRQLGTLKRYLKISADDARHYQA